MRFTKIIATLGPSSASPEMVQQLANHGVDICRLNFSHGNHESHGKVISAIRAANTKRECPMGIMLDTKGPEVRTIDVAEPITIEKGGRYVFTSPKGIVREKLPIVRVDYDKFAHDAKNARCILLDNGVIEFEIERITKDHVIAKALQAGTIGSRRHVNLPGAYISLPSFTAKDLSDIRFGLEQNVDFIAVSFVRSEADILKLRQMLKRHKSDAHIVAKIETPQAVENIRAIVDASDAVMVARGDLGAEVPFEQLPRIQDMIVRLCRLKGKPVIVATHMLESMITTQMPTRAEITDIAHAAISQADCTMLSGETASGRFAIRSVDTMSKILSANERTDGAGAISTFPILSEQPADLPRHEQARAACFLAATLHADAMIVISKTGGTARAVSNCRPSTPILAFTGNKSVQQKMSIVWGVKAHCVPFDAEKPDHTLVEAIKFAQKNRLLKSGSRVVIVSDIRTGKTPVMTVQIRTL